MLTTSNSKLFVKHLSEHAKLPTRGSTLAAGYDLYCSQDIVIPSKDKVVVATDISLAIPEGHYGRVAPRSGLASKHHLDTGAGVIEADYRDPLGVLIIKSLAQDTNKPITSFKNTEIRVHIRFIA